MSTRRDFLKVGGALLIGFRLEGQKLPAGHGVPACMAGRGQKLPEGQAVQDAKAAPPEE